MSHNRVYQKTAFVECIRNGNLQGVQNFLISRSGNLDKSNPRLKECLKEKLNNHKETALHIAVKYEQESIVKWLLQCEADICVTDLYLRTVLHTACDENKGTSIIALILKCRGVDINARDENGITPVWLAAEKGNSSAVKLLMGKGADITMADKADNTSLHVAAKTGQSDVLELLLVKLANKGTIGKQNKDKETPLHLAVTSKNPQCVAMLLNAGAVATMDVKNEQGQNATDLAKEHGNKKIISLLEDPQKAKEHFQAKPKSVLGRGDSVESDSCGCLELPEGLQTGVPFVVMANEVHLKQQFQAHISGGISAFGPGAQVVNAQDAAAVRPPWSAPSGDSHYDVDMSGGYAVVGDNPMINLAPGTPGTPSTAGSSDGSFFRDLQENSSTSSGFPTENPSYLRATESATRPTEGYKINESSRHPVQEELPRDPSDVSTLSRPVQEECPTDKSYVSSTGPVQEETPKDELKESLHHPFEEEHPTDPSDVSSLSHPVQEECPTDKSHVSPTSPVQEESPMGKSNASLPYAVPEESSPRKLDGAVNGSHTEELCTSVQRIGPAKHTDAVGDSSSEEAIAPSDAVEPGEHSRTAIDPGSCDKAGALKATLITKERYSVDQLCGPSESQLNLPGPPNRPVAGARCGSNSSSTCTPNPSESKESSHRKAQHSREPGILDDTLPAGAGANVNESMTTARNGEASFPGNHYGDNPVGTSWDNLSSGTQSSADGSSTTIEIKDDDPKNDRKGDESCDNGCRLM